MDEAGSIEASVATLPRAEPDRPAEGPDSAAWFSIDTDVSLGGDPAGEWLVVSSAGLVVTPREVARGERPAAAARRAIAWSEIERVRTAAGIGGGMLQTRVGGDWVDLVRYSNALATRFHKLARALETAREAAATAGGPVAEPVLDRGGLDPPRCPECSLRLPTADDSCPRCLQQGRILRRVADLVAPHARGALGLVLFTIAGVAAELVPPKLQQYLVDDILAAGDAGGPPSGPAGMPLPDFRTALLVVVLALAASRVLLAVVAVFKGRLASVIGSSLTARLRQEMVDKLQSLSVAYYDRHQVASMISRVAHDSEVLHGLVQQFTGGFLLQIVQLVAVGGMLFWINPTLAAYTLIPVPLVILGSWIFWRHVYPRHYRLWDASAKQMAVLSGMLSGIRVVKAFGQEPEERDRFRSASEHLRGWRQWVDLTGSTYSAAMQIVFSLGGLIVWYVGGRDVLGQKMSLGQLIAFLAYLAMFYAPLGALSSFTTWLTSFLSGSKRVLELLDTPALIPEPAAPVAWAEPRGRIAFRDVTFGYDEHQPVLHDVQQGGIEIDGIDIRRLPTRLLRERLGIVFQESFLFRGTVWKNLAYGRPAATIEEGLAAAKAAGAHDFLCRQPAAYETLLGERGAGLSGGEKQRLSIARTLLADPAILVLDEATSSIDAEAEREIQRALAALIRGRTTIAIAHRLSTLRNADRILAFDRGRLVEQGTHAELLAADGLYARLVRIQTQVSRQPTVDALLAGPPEPAEDPSTAAGATAPAISAADEPADSQATILWLDPAAHRFVRGGHGRIELWDGGRRLAAGVFVVALFPATRPEEYLSVRGWGDDGEERELGIIRRLADWPAAARGIVGDAVARRTLVRTIRRIHALRLARGYLDFDVETDAGRRSFTLRWTQSQAVDFGSDGKLLIDTEDNRWVVPRLADLPRADREAFERHVYW